MRGWNGLNRGLVVALTVVVGTLAVGGTAVECVCGRGPSDSRLEDAKGLVNRGELIGLDRQQLEEKLGRPSRQVGVSREVADQTYWLGYESACIDSRWLAVKFDADGHVETARIAAD